MNVIEPIGHNRLPALLDRIRESDSAVRSHAKAALVAALAAGEALLEAKQILGHGAFGRWLVDAVTIAPRTARLYMALAGNRTVIEAKLATGVASLSVREAALLIAGNGQRTLPPPSSNPLPKGRFGAILAVLAPDLPIPILAAPDCALFVWSPPAELPRALRLLEVHGFAYKSELVWCMPHARYSEVATRIAVNGENLLLGVRGDVPAPAPGDNWASVLFGSPAEGSDHPDIAREMIEAYFPTVPKLELNDNAGRPGWASWRPAAAGWTRMHRFG